MAAATKRSWKLQDFVAHGANVNCLALGHKSGRVLVTGGDDKKVNLWAVGTHNCIMSLGGHSTPVECVRFGHTDELVCAGSQAGALKIWDLEAAKIVRTLTGHKSAIRCMDFHPYGDFLTSGSVDTSIKLWDTRRKGCIFTYKGHALTVNSLKFSPDGQWIASGGEDGLVKLWDLRAGQVLKEFIEHTGPVASVEFHPHEFLLASGSADRTINFFDLENFQLVSTTDRDGGAIRCLYFSQGGECLYAGSNDVLRVCGWEPARIHDTLNMAWGRVADIATAQNQLIGASYHLTNVALFVVDLSKVQPFGGPVINDPVQQSPFRHGQSVRKSFSRETKLNLSKTPISVRTIEEAERSETDPEDDLSATIADIPDVHDYTAIFQPHRSLNRSPPPIPFPAPLDEVGPVFSHIPALLSKEAESSLFFPLTLPEREAPPTSPNQTNSSSLAEDFSFPPSLEPQVPVALSPDQGVYMGMAGSGDNAESPEPIIHSPVRSDAMSLPPETPQPRQRSSIIPDSRRASQLSPVRHRTDRHQGVIPPGPLRAPKGAVSNLQPTVPQVVSAQTTTSPNLTPSSARRISFKEESLSSLENDFPVKLSSIRHSPSEPSLNRPNPNHTRSSSLNRNNGSAGNLKHPGDVPVTFVTKPPPAKPLPLPVDTARRRKTESEPHSNNENGKDDFVPMLADKPSGLDLEEFLTTRLQRSLNVYQPSYVDLSESEVISSLMRGHDPMMAVIAGRTRSLQIVYSLWHNKDLKVAIDAALEMNDKAIIVDLLGILNLRPSIWNLDLCVSMLGPINDLLQSKYEMYMTVGCEALRLILRNFAPVIKTNVQAPVHSVGVDISREERYNKCIKCYESLLAIRSFLLKRQTMQGRLGTTFRELAMQMQTLDN